MELIHLRDDAPRTAFYARANKRLGVFRGFRQLTGANNLFMSIPVEYKKNVIIASLKRKEKKEKRKKGMSCLLQMFTQSLLAYECLVALATVNWQVKNLIVTHHLTTGQCFVTVSALSALGIRGTGVWVILGHVAPEVTRRNLSKMGSLGQLPLYFHTLYFYTLCSVCKLCIYWFVPLGHNDHTFSCHGKT